MTRLALKFAYDGTRFHGYQRQPGLRTVAGEILRSMGELGVCGDPKAARFATASRTDAGVSAIGNVVALDTSFRVKGIARALNSRVQDVWFWGVAPVDPLFNPRHAKERWYRYYLPTQVDAEGLRRGAQLFTGTHDLRGFTRARDDTIREIRTIDVGTSGGLLVLDFRAQAFSWNLIRRIVASLVEYAEGRTTLDEIRLSLADGQPRFGLAAAEPLVLMDVDYGMNFRVEVGRSTAASWFRYAHLSKIRWAFFRELRGISSHQKR